MKREDYIKNKIFENGYTVKSFAAKIEMPYSTLLSILKGAIGGAAVDNVIKICNGLGITIQELQSVDAHLDSVKAGKVAETTETLSTEEKEHIKKYRLLDQHGQKAVDSVLDIEYERCTKVNDKNNLVEIPYVARSETGERGTIVKTQEEINEFLKNITPDTSEQY